jgi:hypothetical protein
MAHTEVSPAAGPLTLSGDLLISGITMPPTIPARSPDVAGTPDANAIPKQSGNATRYTAMLAFTSCLTIACRWNFVFEARWIMKACIAIHKDRHHLKTAC